MPCFFIFFLTKKNKMMNQQIVHVALVVADYDEAIEFYTQKLNFDLINDSVLSETKRWVLVAPKGSNGTALLLAKGVGEAQQSRIGNQTGGRVFLFLKTDDFWRDYPVLVGKGIKFTREPQVFDYGTVAVFEDLYGNLWDFIEFSNDLK
jgi:catechol 2,3-dioxygenase-like lactoylglutathione lyase family enzyme